MIVDILHYIMLWPVDKVDDCTIAHWSAGWMVMVKAKKVKHLNGSISLEGKYIRMILYEW